MKRIILLLFILISLNSIGQITNASYTNKGATVPFLNSSSYKLDGVTLDSANTVKRGFFTKYQYNKLQSISTLYKLKSDSVNLNGFATNFKLNQKVSSQWTTNGSDIYYTTGNVGIGTSATSNALNVSGSSYFEIGNSNVFSIYDTQNSYLINFIEVANLLYNIDPDNVGYNIGIGTSSPQYKLDVNGTIRASENIIVGQRLIHDIYEVAAYTHPDSTITTSASTNWTYLGAGDNNKFSNIYAEGFTLDGDTLQFNQEAYDLRDSVEFNINYSCETATSNVNKDVFYGIFIKRVGGVYKEYKPVTKRVRTASAGVYYTGAICTTMPIWLKDGDKIQIRVKVGATTTTVSTQSFGTYLKEE